MAKINELGDKLRWVYSAGFFVILALPILVIPPYFFPPDWGKAITFRSIMAIMLFLFVLQLLYKKCMLNWQNIKKNTIFWILTALLGIFLLATIFSVDPYFSLWGSPYRGGGFITFAFYFVFAFMAFLFFKKRDWTKAWIFSIGIGVIVSLVAVIQYYGLFRNIFISIDNRPASTMGNPILLSTYLLLLFFVTLAFAIKENGTPFYRSWKKILYGLSSLLFIYTILIAGSRAAYLGLLIGGIYFLLFYPKKIAKAKITVVTILLLSCAFVGYINTTSQYPKFLEQNKLFNSVATRLSIRQILNDPRFYAWAGIEYKVVANRPLLGYGPENFSVGFDKYYDPSIPYLNEPGNSWWDKAHNALIQVTSEAGIFALIIYLALFIVLFLKLQKIKSDIMPHAIQATLIGYLIANFFSFDSFSTYLIFFLIIAYSMNLIYGEPVEEPLAVQRKKSFLQPTVISVLFVILAIFLIQYNLVPFIANVEINKAGYLADQKNCNQAFTLMDKVLQQHSFIDSYSVMEYIVLEKTCSAFYSENALSYTQKGFELLQSAVKIQPLYTRYWIYLGNLSNILADQESLADAKNNLVTQAKDYFAKALQLAPKHQEILTGLAKTEIIAGNYKNAIDYSQKCIDLNSNLGDCYWYLSISEIYSGDKINANKNIQLAGEKGYDINSQASLIDLANAYGSFPDYPNLVIVFEKLSALNPNVAQFHSYLATFYTKLGEYEKARQETAKVEQLSPK